SVSVRGNGHHTLTFRRVFDLARASITVPVTPIATARVRIEGHGLVVEDARGHVLASDEQAERALEPIDRFEVRAAHKEVVARSARAVGRALVLWDALPAGDRVRIRLIWRDGARGSRLTIPREPGWNIRSIAAPGAVDWQPT